MASEEPTSSLAATTLAHNPFLSTRLEGRDDQMVTSPASTLLGKDGEEGDNTALFAPKQDDGPLNYDES